MPQDQIPCGQCQQNPPFFDHTIAAFKYEGSVAYMIQNFKFHEHLATGKFLSEQLWEKLCDYYQDKPWPELILTVPLHHTRLRQRGFNQALELAKPLAKKLKLKLPLKLLIKNRTTKSQAESDFHMRHKNIRDAFALTQTLHAQHIAIVDDVMTTGATVNEIAKVLKTAGAKTIDIWCIARAC